MREYKFKKRITKEIEETHILKFPVFLKDTHSRFDIGNTVSYYMLTETKVIKLIKEKENTKFYTHFTIRKYNYSSHWDNIIYQLQQSTTYAQYQRITRKEFMGVYRYFMKQIDISNI